jgi:hypothetical protein
MMLSWSFAVRMVDEVVRLLRAMEKHRYLQEVDHRVHFTVDRALRDLPMFAKHASAFDARLAKEPGLELASRDPSLWRKASLEEIVEVFLAFWGPERAKERRERLIEEFEKAGLPIAEHDPFAADPEDPPFPELVWLDWVFLPVDQLDPERHTGALAALADSGVEANPSAPIYVEGPSITIVELCDGAPLGILEDDFFLWAEPPVPYVDYVFRGVSKQAQLPEPPVGPDDQPDDEAEAAAPA